MRHTIRVGASLVDHRLKTGDFAGLYPDRAGDGNDKRRVAFSGRPPLSGLGRSIRPCRAATRAPANTGLGKLSRCGERLGGVGTCRVLRKYYFRFFIIRDYAIIRCLAEKREIFDNGALCD